MRGEPEIGISLRHDWRLSAGIRTVARREPHRRAGDHEQTDHAEPDGSIDPERANQDWKRNTFAGKTAPGDAAGDQAVRGAAR